MIRTLVWFVAFSVLTVTSPSAATSPKVVASINPVHSLVAGVMQGVGEPTLLLKGGESPHTAALRPSEARALRQADLVFWVGDDLETFLPKALRARGKKGAVKLSAAEGVGLLKIRAGGAWEAHDHGHGDHHDHGHSHGHDHGKKDHHDHGHAKHDHGKKHDHGHAKKGHDDHAGEHDLHLWLDPVKAKAMVRAIAAVLAKTDAANAARYRSNADNVMARLDALDGELRNSLAPIRNKPFVVFHDAYQYFERRYGLNAVGSVTLSPEVRPGAKRLHEIRSKLISSKAACVFSEPQFESKLVQTVVRGTEARTGELDPLGADVPEGPLAYDNLLRNLASNMIACLKAPS